MQLYTVANVLSQGNLIHESAQVELVSLHHHYQASNPVLAPSDPTHTSLCSGVVKAKVQGLHASYSYHL